LLFSTTIVILNSKGSKEKNYCDSFVVIIIENNLIDESLLPDRCFLG
jgi:hypothetical protein